MSALRSPIRSALFAAIRAVIRPPLIGGGGLWNPGQWFNNGEQGVWFDLDDDMGTKLAWVAVNGAAGFMAQFPNHALFQDVAGTTPVTAVGQPLGLVLDKSKGGLGPDVIDNGTFDSGIAGWTAVMSGAISWDAGALRIENIAGNFGSAVQTVPEVITAGKTYRVSGELLDARNHLGAVMAGRIALGGVQNPAVPIGPFSFLLTATDSTPTRVFHASSTGGAFSVWGSVSVREVPGSQISQVTAARRPLWGRLATGKFGITGDGVDDRIERSASGMEWPEFSYLCVGSSAALGDMQGTLSFGPFLEFWHAVNWQGFGAFLRTAVGSPEHPRSDLEVYDTDAIFSTLSSTRFRPVFANQPVVYSTYCENNLQTAQINGDSKWTGGAPYTPISPIGNSNLVFRANGVVWSLSDAVLINRRITDAEFQQYVNYSERVFAVVTPAPQWTPANWFSNSEEGTWFKLSDFSTLFQDPDGLVPVTAVEQPVGLVLDKSGSGNHIRELNTARRPKLSARRNFIIGSASPATQNIAATQAEYTLSHVGAGTITLSGVAAGSLVGAGSLTFSASAQGVLTLTMSGAVVDAQLEFGSEVTRYQRVDTATDYDTVGFPHYLQADGIDDQIGIAPLPVGRMAYAEFSHVQCGMTQNVVPNAFVGPGLWFADSSARQGLQVFVQEHLGRPLENPSAHISVFATPTNGWTSSPKLDGVKFYSPTIVMATSKSQEQSVRANSSGVTMGAFQPTPVTSPNGEYTYWGGNQWRLYESVSINRILTDAEYNRFKTYMSDEIGADFS